MNPEATRLEEARNASTPWRKWGPYLSERQWGTVREDYSENGDAWNYFTHDQARSRTYRWGEDGIAGISDDRQILCFALALWNGKDPIIKERLFGLANNESNHGEDVKECYFYLDSTPTHSYMKYLYKYPQSAYPYNDLVSTSRQRSRHDPEYELIDTGVFNENRYFDVFVEYAKASPDDILIRITVHNRGPKTAHLHVLPTLWFRDRWSWQNVVKPSMSQLGGDLATAVVHTADDDLGDRYLWCDSAVPLLFTENATNKQRLFNTPNQSPYVKDSINDYLLHDKLDAINPERTGTKVAAHYQLNVPAGKSKVIRLRLSNAAPIGRGNGSAVRQRAAFDAIFASRVREADEFYSEVIPKTLGADANNVMRQALAGMLWTKQFYHYDVDKWLSERGSNPFKKGGKASPRNEQWHHMWNGDIISMPDKWEYPWYAAWDLAFHVIAISLVDLDFAKQQLQLMLRERYMHPNGQMPAYEWNFGDVNPPVHAWSVIFIYRQEKLQRGAGDIKWLKTCFRKLLLNFTWWVNRKDRQGRNVFEGGFLGLDNIGVFDRSAPLPTGGFLEQADGTAWMALFAHNMLEIAKELAMTDEDYLDMVMKFLEHGTWITASLANLGDGIGMWDEEDGFFYDVLRRPDGQAMRLKVRSMVGLLPLCAATVFEPKLRQKFPMIDRRFSRFLEARPELCAACHDLTIPGVNGRRLFAVLNEKKLRRVLEKMLDENEFFGPFGIRSLSRYHEKNPYVMHVGSNEYRVSYLPGESDSGMFGGNSNWRGPVWLPVNLLIMRSLLHFYSYYGDNFLIECPTGSGRRMNLYQVASELATRLSRIFLKDKDGRRPCYGATEIFQKDPHWRDYVLFYEYFHGDNGAGLGASHQTGWTGIIARIMHAGATSTAEEVLELGSQAVQNVTDSDWGEQLNVTGVR